MQGEVMSHTCKHGITTGIKLGRMKCRKCADEEHGRLREKLSTLRVENERLVEALRFYEKHISNCNKYGKDGDTARDILAKDSGDKARLALQEPSDG